MALKSFQIQFTFLVWFGEILIWFGKILYSFGKILIWFGKILYSFGWCFNLNITFWKFPAIHNYFKVIYQAYVFYILKCSVYNCRISTVVGKSKKFTIYDLILWRTINITKILPWHGNFNTRIFVLKRLLFLGCFFQHSC